MTLVPRLQQRHRRRASGGSDAVGTQQRCAACWHARYSRCDMHCVCLSFLTGSCLWCSCPLGVSGNVAAMFLEETFLACIGMAALQQCQVHVQLSYLTVSPRTCHEVIEASQLVLAQHQSSVGRQR